ncbi:hypothetical protein PTKIN_Ptkin09bG0047900 [Pterospermum kingtungense]
MNGEIRPWLKYKPSGDHANSGSKEAKQDPKLQPPLMKKKDNATAIYHKVIAEVASNTLGAFLEHYGDDSVHVRFQEVLLISCQFYRLWTLKVKEKRDKLGRFAGNVPPAVVIETPLPDLNPLCERRKEYGSEIGTFTQEVPPVFPFNFHALVDGHASQAPSQTTVSIPFPGESIQFQSLLANQDGTGTNSKSAAYMELGKTAACGDLSDFGRTENLEAPLQTTISIPFPGECIQFQSLPANQDGNGTNSKSAARMELSKTGSCKRPSIPSLTNAGFEEAKPKKHKTQQLHQPWLKQKPFGIQDNSGLVDARQIAELRPFAMNYSMIHKTDETSSITVFRVVTSINKMG